MQIEIRELPERKAAAMSHSGAYHMIGKTFMEFGSWAKESGVSIGEGVGIYYDDPSATPEAALRSDAGALVADDFQTTDPRVHIVTVPGGACAVGKHVGPYDGIPAAWGELYGWVHSKGYSPRMAPGYELYLNDMGVAPADLETELYLPIEKPKS